MNKIIASLALFFALAFILFSTTLYVVDYKFECNVKGYLQRTANANNVKNANENLTKVISYLEEKNLTKGNSSLFFDTPENDIAYWYKNLKDAQVELQSIPENVSLLEQSNVLIKLRETLISHSDKGEELIIPENLQYYPFQIFWNIIIGFDIASVILFIILVIFLSKEEYDLFWSNF
jgi:hypothetical protein